MKITFTKTVQLESEGRNMGPTFKAGSTHDFPEGTALRWVRRGVAETYVSKAAGRASAEGGSAN
jgi:hypothetical protein